MMQLKERERKKEIENVEKKPEMMERKTNRERKIQKRSMIREDEKGLDIEKYRKEELKVGRQQKKQ